MICVFFFQTPTPTPSDPTQTPPPRPHFPTPILQLYTLPLSPPGLFFSDANLLIWVYEKLQFGCTHGPTYLITLSGERKVHIFKKTCIKFIYFTFSNVSLFV